MRKASNKFKPIRGSDADELEAVAQAAAVLQSFARVENPEAVAHAVISTWIIERMKRATGARLTDNIVFNLDEAHLKGMVAAALPQIADALDAADFPFAKTFSDLTREEALQLFTIGCVAHREAAVAAGESPDFPFSDNMSDPIPFGEFDGEIRT